MSIEYDSMFVIGYKILKFPEQYEYFSDYMEYLCGEIEYCNYVESGNAFKGDFEFYINIKHTSNEITSIRWALGKLDELEKDLERLNVDFSCSPIIDAIGIIY